MTDQGTGQMVGPTSGGVENGTLKGESRASLLVSLWCLPFYDEVATASRLLPCSSLSRTDQYGDGALGEESGFCTYEIGGARGPRYAGGTCFHRPLRGDGTSPSVWPHNLYQLPG